MKKSLFNGRRGWFIAGTAAVLLFGSAAAATASLSTTDPAPGHSQEHDRRAHDDDGHDDTGQTSPSRTAVSASGAAEIALGAVPDGVVTEVELEGRRSNNPVWNVDLVSPGYEHEVYVDATTGEVRGHDRDDDDDDWEEDSSRAAAAAVGIADAEQVALSEVPDGVVLDVELEGPTSQPIWIFEVYSPSDATWKYIKIDAVTGSILAVNDDYIGDDNDDWGNDDDDDDD